MVQLRRRGGFEGWSAVSNAGRGRGGRRGCMGNEENGERKGGEEKGKTPVVITFIQANRPQTEHGITERVRDCEKGTEWGEGGRTRRVVQSPGQMASAGPFPSKKEETAPGTVQNLTMNKKE